MAGGRNLTLEEICEAVRSAGRIRIEGAGTHEYFIGSSHGENLSMSRYGGIVTHDVDDQVVVVRAGTPLSDLNAELSERGQTIPYVSPLAVGTVGGSVSMNLPHLLESQCGSWRDWVLGLTVVRSDGTVAKCGSKAVKNVAGYDVQKLFIGARGRLGVIAEVILRTYPLRALWSTPSGGEHCESVRIQRVLRSDFAKAAQANVAELIESDSETGTLWTRRTDPPRYDHDWLIDSDQVFEPRADHYLRMKALFDPENKF